MLTEAELDEPKEQKSCCQSFCNGRQLGSPTTFVLRKHLQLMLQNQQSQMLSSVDAAESKMDLKNGLDFRSYTTRTSIVENLLLYTSRM